MKILYIGNYEQQHCTEVHIANTLEAMGHEVHRHQEQREGVISQRLPYYDYDFVLWTRTWRGYVTQRFLDACKSQGVPTVSYHLDLYLGLQREADMVNDPFWNTDYVFTPDGDPNSAKVFAAKGIRHFYMPPGVYAPECKKGTPRDAFRADVVFVGGSIFYHREDWPYRMELINFLKQTYGKRFKIYGHPYEVVRNQDLNDLYASAKVIVGDSLCKDFTHERYWSDRLYETTGRGGFLIHPYIKGIEDSFNILGKTNQPAELITYDFGDFAGLKGMIDFYLEHDQIREKIRDRAFARAKRDHTYTQRLTDMIKIVEGGNK